MFSDFIGQFSEDELEQRDLCDKLSKLFRNETDGTEKPSSTHESHRPGSWSKSKHEDTPRSVFNSFLSTDHSDKVSAWPSGAKARVSTSTCTGGGKSASALAAQMSKEELCDHYEKVASNVPCTYSTDGETRYPQPWFECYTCWGGESNFGSCFPCALKCHQGHELVAHPKLTSSFYCDCGKNNHQADVCIQYSAGSEVSLVPWYKCFTCFHKRDANAGCCYQCVKNCHRGHDVSFAGSRVGRCNCGNPKYTKAKCLIAKPKVQRWE